MHFSDLLIFLERSFTSPQILAQFYLEFPCKAKGENLPFGLYIKFADQCGKNQIGGWTGQTISFQLKNN